MIRPFWKTIRGRLLAYLLPPLVLVLAVGVYLDYETGAAPVREAYDHALASAALTIATQARSDTGAAGLAQLAGAVDTLLHPEAPSRAYFVVRAGERYLAGDADLPVAPTGATNPRFFDTRFRGEAVRVATYSLPGASPLVVSVAETTGARYRATMRLLLSEVLTDVVQLLATVGLVWIGVALALRPMSRLRHQIATRSPRELSRLDIEEVPGEARSLVEELNRLFTTLGEASRAQQHFLANAAHQMRTPLAALLIQLDLLIAEIAAGPLRQELLAVRQSAQNLAHTADQLLTLARADPAVQLANEFASLDCGRLIEDVVAQNLDRALQKGIDLGAQIEAAEVAGVPWLIREVLSNLVDNALRYVPSGGHVTVRCGTLDGRACLEVDDDGPGIAVDQRSAVRERFYRVPGTPGSGCGLGLAIADEVARLHGAELEISDCDGIGTRVLLRFPSPGKARSAGSG